jgi:hypothetical protein
MDSKFHQFISNDNTRGKIKYYCCKSSGFLWGVLLKQPAVPNSVTLSTEAVHFSKISEQMHYTTQHKNPEHYITNIDGMMTGMTSEILNLLTT